MDEAVEQRLRRAAGEVSRETMARLDRLVALLQKWNSRINLVAPSTMSAIWERHVVDSAQLLPLGRGACRWVDLGSGGGFPGLVIAALLADRTDARVHLVESNSKKAAFLAAAAAELGLAAEIHRCRIEDSLERTGAAEVVTARALAPMNDLLGLAAPLLTDAIGLFHKGRDFVGEVARARDEWDFDLLEHTSLVDPDGRILEIRNVRAHQRPPTMDPT